jgi:hypothetical protein
MFTVHATFAPQPRHPEDRLQPKANGATLRTTALCSAAHLVAICRERQALRAGPRKAEATEAMADALDVLQADLDAIGLMDVYLQPGGMLATGEPFHPKRKTAERPRKTCTSE